MKVRTSKKTLISSVLKSLQYSVSLPILFFFAGFLTSTSSTASSPYMLSNALQKQPSPEWNLPNALRNSNLPLINQVTRLYELRDFQLIWSDGKEYNQNAKELFTLIQQADLFGLDPFDYDIEFIQYFLEATNVHPPLLSKSEITFTHAYIKLASHVELGKLRFPEFEEDKNLALLDVLNKAVDTQTLSTLIEQLQPKDERYSRLVKALQKYRKLSKNPQLFVTGNRSLQMGDRSPDVAMLRKILRNFGDYRGSEQDSDLFDEELMVAVSEFQFRHGLEMDGIAGKQTLLEINKPIGQRIQQLELNLERIRRLPASENKRYLLINIPAYQLYMIENNQVAYQSRVVVGKTKHKTPTLSSELHELVLNPYWNVPRSIAKNEIIPLIQKDPNYLSKNNMKLLGKLTDRTIVVNPQTIDWETMDSDKITLRFRQEPGAGNSLGQIKFLFPNTHSVYLHDTPSRNLFTRAQRAFSHGCIRVENPFALAEVLLSGNGDLSKYDLMYLARNKKRKSIVLDQPIPIHITYMTSWTDEHGKTHFRSDIYQRDSKIAAKLYNNEH